MKITTLDNLLFEVDAKDEDKISEIKERLSSIVRLSVDQIGLVYKNRILYDESLLKEYGIGPDEFVILCDVSQQFRNEQEAFDQTDSQTRLRLRRGESLSDDPRSILIYVKFANKRKTYFVRTISNEVIFDALQRIFEDMRYLYFTFNDVYLDVTQTFSDYGIGHGNTICVENLSETGLREFIIIKFCSIKKDYHSVSTCAIPNSNMGKLKKMFSKLINLPPRSIVLYKDETGDVEITDNENLGETRQIYFDVIADFENLVKKEMLGRGSFGSVYKCEELKTHKEFALKEFRFSDNNSTEAVAFQEEVSILCSLGCHNRIIKFEKQFVEKDAFYILMEYAPKGSLSIYLKKHRSLSEVQIIKFSTQILEALEYLHGLSIVHRDIKGENVLLDEDENIKLCDFSVSKVLINAASKGFLNGITESFVGTANWMAPEIICGKSYGPEADIWSFGATVVEMLTGKPPYSNFGYYTVIFKIGSEKKIVYEIPLYFTRPLKNFLDSCLHSVPSDRPTAATLLGHPFLKQN